MFKIRKSDTVLIITGKDRGKSGKIIKIFPEEDKAIVEGLNLRKKNRRPRKAGEKGQIIEYPAKIHLSNLKLICPRCSKAVRVNFKLEAGQKFRICKKCGQEV